MLPVITFVAVAIPLLVLAFIVVRRRTDAGEHASSETAADRRRIEQEFEEAERYQAELRKEQQ